MMAEVQRNTFVLIIYEHTKVILMMIAIFAIYLRRRLGKALLSLDSQKKTIFAHKNYNILWVTYQLLTMNKDILNSN